MKQLLKQMMDRFAEERNGAFGGNSVASLFSQELPAELVNSGVIMHEMNFYNISKTMAMKSESPSWNDRDDDFGW